MKGIIYAIKSKQTDNIYIGSTLNTIKERMKNHRGDYNKYKLGTHRYMTSFKLLEYDDYYYEIIEELDINDKKELHKKEGEYQLNTNNCINKLIAGRTTKEYLCIEENKEKRKQQRKIYEEINKETIKQQQKIYNENHREELKKKREENKEHNNNISKQYYNIIKDTLLEKRKEKMTCECGVTCRKADISTHYKSKKHINFCNNNIM
jgi:hypothetical protein